MMLAGHFLEHIPQPMHLDESIMAHTPFGIEIALILHALRQHPHATHRFWFTKAFLFIINTSDIDISI